MKTVVLYLEKKFIMLLVNIRWGYFHVNPSYIKFYVDNDNTEAYFQHKTKGTLHGNLVWVG